MKRWKTLNSRSFATASFGLMVSLLGAASGCQIITSIDRTDVQSGGSGGSGNAGGMAGTGGMGGAGGTGGTGGMAGCTTKDDCPGTDTACRTRTCIDATCGFSNADMGTPTANQVDGDCKREVCDGMGTVTTETDATDILDDLNDCTADTCNGETPENMPINVGSGCASNGGKVCDGQGACVECNVSGDCSTGVCMANQCVPASCADQVKNGTETDVDCGGSVCTPCGDGKACGGATDCQSGVCTSMTCAAATCTDALENGDETDVDCGGATCTPCAPGLGCNQNADCVGGSCSGTICLPTCTDGVKNANETDEDCGGPDCSPCMVTQTCSVNSDCVDGVCVAGQCQAATCSDTVKNGQETGVDCGGNCPSKCAAGSGCTAGSDCSSGICTMMICQAAMCSDMQKNGSETDVDCGGGGCPGCALGQICQQGSDCLSTFCVSGLCVVSICGDGIVSGMEACDDGNLNVGDGCNATCNVEMGYACSGMPSVCGPVCGDGTKLGNEACDDGNLNSGDCCSSACALESGCEIEPNNTDATANAWTTVAIGNKVKAFNNPTLDKDVFSVIVPPNNKGTLVAEVKDGPAGSTCSNPTEIDSYLTVRNSAGATLATNDDILQPTNFCSKVTVTNLDPGTYFVEAKRTTLAPAGLATYDYTLQIDMTFVTCGDGSIGTGETCDDGNSTSNDGCSSACAIEQGWGCTGQPSACTFTCGNGTISGNEQCDDNNTMNGDGCSSVCLLETVTAAEPNNSCAQTSGPFLPPFLLDGAITPTGDQDYIAITVPAYADLKIETFAPTYGTCALGTDTFIELRGPSCSTVILSDDEDGINSCSLIDSAVTADAAARHLAPGTYYVRVEEYLNNATIAAYKLQVSFNALCGNGTKEGSEQCDGGANCGMDCMLLPFCGDGQVANGEQCDDGGTMNGDGCSSTCTVEADYRCTGTPSVCTMYETNCSDGVDNDADGNIDAMDVDCVLPAYFPACGGGQTLRVYKSFDTPKAIPDNNMTGVTSFVSIVNNVGTISSAAVLLDVTHTWIEDIDATLVSPANASFDLTSDNGGSGDNYSNTLLKASCPAITSAMAPFANCYAPEVSLAPLTGTGAQGLWQLEVADDAMADFGTLNRWALVLCTVP